MYKTENISNKQQSHINEPHLDFITFSLLECGKEEENVVISSRRPLVDMVAPSLGQNFVLYYT